MRGQAEATRATRWVGPFGRVPGLRGFDTSNRSRSAGQRGAATVEFAIVITLFMLFLLGVLDFGRGIAAYSAIAHGAREGARAGIYADTSDDQDICAALLAHTTTVPDLVCTPPQVVITRVGGVDHYGATLTVEVNYTFRAVTPLIGQFFPGGLLLKASASTIVQ